MRGMRIAGHLRNRLPNGEFGRSVLTVVLGTGIAQLVVIASSPVLTRLYLPSDYGVWAVATSLLSVLISVTCLRYEYAIPLPASDVEAANVLSLSLVANLAMSLAAGAVLVVAGPAILAIFGATVLAPYVLLISLGQFGGGVVSALASWAIRTKSFGDIAATRLVQAISLVTVQVVLGFLRTGGVGLLVGDTVGRISGSSRLARSAWRGHAASFRQVSLSGISAAANRYRRFPIFSSWSALLATLGLQAPLLLLVAVYGTTVGGHFALAARICSIPLTLIAGAVGQVFVAEAARLARDDPRQLRPLFRRTTLTLARTAIGPAALLALAAPILAGPVFGANWTETGLFVAILAPSYFVEFVMGATGDALYVVERQDLHLAREILRFGFVGGAIPLAGALHLEAVQGVILLSVAGIVTYSLYGLITWWAIRRHAARGARPPTADRSVEDIARPPVGLGPT
jgi:O-antigen/teichoic acid export membrane protein